MAKDGGEEAWADLARVLEALANPRRLHLLKRLERPAFLPELARELGVTRQGLRKHLAALESVDLVVAQRARRRGLPAARYAANPAALFAFRESIQDLAVSAPPEAVAPAWTLPAGPTGARGGAPGAGLLLVHGDVPGRWYPLTGAQGCVLGRARDADVCLAYDPFASLRHALLRRAPGGGWTLTDLRSRNGTRVNFRTVAPAEPAPVRGGDLLSVGRSHLLLRAEG